MAHYKKLIGVAAASMALILMSACEREGPAESMGKKIDEAAASGAEKAENLVDKTGKALEQAGENIQEKARELQQQTK